MHVLMPLSLFITYYLIIFNEMFHCCFYVHRIGLEAGADITVNPLKGD